MRIIRGYYLPEDVGDIVSFIVVTNSGEEAWKILLDFWDIMEGMEINHSFNSVHIC